MYGYDEEYFSESSEFEIMIEDFKDTLRKEIKEGIRNKIDYLEKELASVDEYRKDKNNLIKKHEKEISAIKSEYEKKERELSLKEEKLKKARLHELLGDYLTIGFRPSYKKVMGEKCNKCDENRKIHFFSPRGREYTEDCDCAKGYYEYYLEETELAKIYVRKKNFGKNKDVDFYNRYYTKKDDGDCDRYDYASEIYQPTMSFEDINSYRIVFLNEDDCKKYCEWKTEQSKKKNNQ